MRRISLRLAFMYTRVMLQADLENLFNSCLETVHVSFYQNHAEQTDFDCIFTSSKNKVPKQLSYYSHPALLRVLVKKSGILNDELYYQVFDTDTKEFCFISQWSNLKKQFVIFHLQGLNFFDETKFLNTLSESKKKFEQYFEEINASL